MTGRSARDVLVTGMGFCLPGGDEPVVTAEDLWQTASRGRCHLTRNDEGIYYGSVTLAPGVFARHVPDYPASLVGHLTEAHRFGLVSLAAACADAGLHHRAGQLGEAAVLAGRGAVDANIGRYLAMLAVDLDTVGVGAAGELLTSAALALTPSDVALVQSALLRSTGPSFTVSCGCSSSSVQLGNARHLISRGEVDVAVVTGVDTLRFDLLHRLFQLVKVVQRSGGLEIPDQVMAFDRLMRPYDRRTHCVNYGEGSATVVLESREHADRRGARPYGQILAQSIVRDGLGHPLASDDTGAGLVAAVRGCLAGRWHPSEIPYVHGGSDGGMCVLESNAIRQLYGPAARDLLMTSQEGCFGHNGAPTGALGVALTLLMMQRHEVCPTANCEEPLAELPFDPVPGVRTRPLQFDRALVFTYQLGGLQSALLLGRP
jgi:3-oxoacyl-[acyl-carrier-protein] synthase II